MIELPEGTIAPAILEAFERIEAAKPDELSGISGYFEIRGITLADPILITRERPKSTPKTKKPVYPTQDGLLLLPAEPIEEWGDCPGGRYRFVTRVIDAVELLDQWSAEERWAAIDLETSIAYRYRTDETTGEQIRWHPDKVIDPHVSTIFLCSISVCPEEAYVLDMRALCQSEEFIASFRRFITTCGLVAQNSFFEQSFLMAHFGVRARIEYDTLIVSQILNAGRKISNGLGALYKRHLGIEADKSWQHGFLNLHETSPLPNAAIAYSAGDVCQLLTLAQRLHAELKASGMLKVWEEIEKPLLPWMAEAKVHGIELDRSVLERLRVELTEKVRERQAIFEAIAPDALISSPKQLLEWFNANGWEIISTDEKKVLEPMLKRDPDSPAGQAARALLDYREVQKLLTTYVEPMLSTHPSPRTGGRIHPDWKQNSTDTGRMACGEPTVMNWPSKGPYTWIRNALVAEPGHTLVYVDYGQFEVRSLADQANEVTMIRAFEDALAAGKALKQRLTELELPQNVVDLREKEPEHFSEIIAQYPDVGQLIERLDECDFHRQTASALFKKPAAEITKQERTLAKTALFAVIYGAGAKGLAEQTKTTKEEAQDLITSFYVRFPFVEKFMTRVRKKALSGWTASPAGRRRFYPQPDRDALYRLFRAQKQEHDRIWAEFHASVPDSEEARDGLSIEEWLKKQKIKKPKKTDWEKSSASSRSKDPLDMAKRQVNMQLAGIEREGGNAVIQSSNADATKLATVLAAPRLRELDPTCMILMWVHDEIVLTAPEHLAQQAAAILESAMIEAAQENLKRVPIECSVTIAKCWSK
jgi:DNA polymerase I-like protein with 3'-5' exonuclease and polymerase domains